MRTELPADIVRISLPTPFEVGEVNAYLLLGERPALIDTGPNLQQAWAALDRTLIDHGLGFSDLQVILITHQHHDHAGLAATIRERSGAQVMALTPLAQLLGSFEEAMDCDDAFAVAMMLRHGIEAETARALDGISRAFRRFGQPTTVDRSLDDGDTVRAGDRQLVVRARPGHSPTDTVFYDESDGLLFGGDHVLRSISSNPFQHCPIGALTDKRLAAPHHTGTLPRYLTSLRQTAAMHVSMVLPGHRAPFRDHRTIIEERLAMHARRADEVLSHLDGPTTAAALVDTFWPNLPVRDMYLGLSEILGHLELLQDEGRVVSIDGEPERFVRQSPGSSTTTPSG